MNINYAVVSAFERSKKPERQRSTTRFFTVALMGVFFVVLMGMLAVGASIYSSIVGVKAYTDDTHIQSGLLANTVHVNDAVFAVESGDGPEGPALVLVEALETGTYETRIYLYNGTLYQEYAIAGRDYNPKTATPLFESNTFEFSFDGELLSMTTDQGTLDVALRSRQGAGL